MAENNGIAGIVIGIKFNDKYIRCQLDSSLTFDNSYEEDESCKPLSEEEDMDLFIRRILQSQDTSITVNHRSFIEQAGAELSPADITQLIIDGDVEGVAEVLTTPGKHTQPNDIIIEVPVVIGSYAWNFPRTGRANADLTLLGNGKPTQQVIPVSS